MDMLLATQYTQLTHDHTVHPKSKHVSAVILLQQQYFRTADAGFRSSSTMKHNAKDSALQLAAKRNSTRTWPNCRRGGAISCSHNSSPSDTSNQPLRAQLSLSAATCLAPCMEVTTISQGGCSCQYRLAYVYTCFYHKLTPTSYIERAGMQCRVISTVRKIDSV
eukprot:21112-Heterococcus_DN1.PRE.2